MLDVFADDRRPRVTAVSVCILASTGPRPCRPRGLLSLGRKAKGHQRDGHYDERRHVPVPLVETTKLH
jgi:hypothetical protein